MIDMSSNLAAAATVALGGAALVRSMKTPTNAISRRRWLPAIAFISGPLITVGWQLIDIYYVTKFTHPDDIAPMFIAAIAIGLLAGTIGAVSFYIFER